MRGITQHINLWKVQNSGAIAVRQRQVEQKASAHLPWETVYQKKSVLNEELQISELAIMVTKQHESCNH